jgi:PBP1b-binding outer membrane lipoprotein LpoB
MGYAKQTRLAAATTVLLMAALISAPSLAAETNGANQTNQSNQKVNTSHKGEAQDLITKATQEVRTMEADPQLKQLDWCRAHHCLGFPPAPGSGNLDAASWTRATRA